MSSRVPSPSQASGSHLPEKAGLSRRLSESCAEPENYLMILQPDVIYFEIRSESSEITVCLSTTVGRITGGQLRKSRFEGFELLCCRTAPPSGYFREPVVSCFPMISIQSDSASQYDFWRDGGLWAVDGPVGSWAAKVKLTRNARATEVPLFHVKPRNRLRLPLRNSMAREWLCLPRAYPQGETQSLPGSVAPLRLASSQQK